MREKKAILLLVLSACLFAIDFILKGDLGKVMFYIILLIGWILLLAYCHDQQQFNFQKFYIT